MIFFISGLRLEHISPSLGVNGNTSNPSQYTPRGATPLLAAQIEREIDELKTLFKVLLFNMKKKNMQWYLFEVLNFRVVYSQISLYRYLESSRWNDGSLR